MKNIVKTFLLGALASPFAFLLSGCNSSEPDIKDPIPVRVAVTGAVMLPGQKTFWINNENRKPPTLFYSIGLSGGPRKDAYLEEVVLHRGALLGKGKTIIVNLKEIMTAEKAGEKDYPLEDGDVVEVLTFQQAMDIINRGQ